MSQADIERFVADLQTNPDLLAEVTKSAGDIASIVEIANGKGYEVSLDEAKAYINAQAKGELSDEQLNAVAGGNGGRSDSTCDPTTLPTSSALVC